MHEKYNQGIKEGRTYEFENFIVSPNSYKYRPTNHPFKITFTAHTYFSEEEADLPMYSYSFKSIREIIAMPEDENVDHLIGFVKSMGSLDDFNSQDGSTKPFLRMTICDPDDNEIECVLFDQCATDACLAQMQNADTTAVALINLGRVTWTEDKHHQIASSFAATHVYFNHVIKEVKELIDSVKDRSTPITMQFSQSMPTQRSRVSGGHSLHGQPKVTLDNIKEQSIGDGFVVGCELVKFETKFGWSYEGCSKCSSMLKPLDDKRKRKEGFPKDLQDQVGKKLLLKLKLNNYNKRFPGSSINASTFTACEDLLGEFNSASSGVEQLPGSDSSKVPGSSTTRSELPHGNKESSYSDSTNHAIDLSEEDTPTMNLQQLIAQTGSKGKRRISSTKRGQREGTPNTGHQPSNGMLEERILKNVKQKKP